MVRVRKHECLGGPLCGRMVARVPSMNRFFVADDAGDTHFYRLLKIVADDGGSAAMFFHYCGTDPQRCEDFMPTMRPSPDMFKPIKRRK
jgi:hypothetical protein